jgi:uncharacterized protein YceK
MNNQENDTILRVLTLLMLAITLLMCISVFSFKQPEDARSIIHPINHSASSDAQSRLKSLKTIDVPFKFYTEPNVNYSAEKNIFEAVHKVKA